MEGFFLTFDDIFSGGFTIFTLALLFIFLIFMIIIGIILVRVIRAIVKWNHNNQQPRLTSQAKVVTKRTVVRGGGESRTYQDYYVTFELYSGERVELEVKGTEYGQLVEGDRGELHFQGTRYFGFSREHIVS